MLDNNLLIILFDSGGYGQEEGSYDGNQGYQKEGGYEKQGYQRGFRKVFILLIGAKLNSKNSEIKPWD